MQNLRLGSQHDLNSTKGAFRRSCELQRFPFFFGHHTCLSAAGMKSTLDEDALDAEVEVEVLE